MEEDADRPGHWLREVWDEYAVPVGVGALGALGASRIKGVPRKIRTGDKVKIRGDIKDYNGEIVNYDKYAKGIGDKAAHKDIQAGRVITEDSPLGEGIRGRKVGETIEIPMPSGSIARYEIVQGPEGPSLKLIGAAGTGAAASAYGVQEVLGD